LRPGSSNPLAEGAEIEWQAEGLPQRRLRSSGGSFLSSHDHREILGLGSSTSASVKITWPSGKVTLLPSSKAGQYLDAFESAESTLK